MIRIAYFSYPGNSPVVLSITATVLDAYNDEYSINLNIANGTYQDREFEAITKIVVHIGPNSYTHLPVVGRQPGGNDNLSSLWTADTQLVVIMDDNVKGTGKSKRFSPKSKK